MATVPGPRKTSSSTQQTGAVARRASPPLPGTVAPPWADNGEATARRKAVRDGLTLLQPIRDEAMLEQFVVNDPEALESTLHGSSRWGFVQHLWRLGMMDGRLGDAHGDVAGTPLSIIRVDNRSAERIEAAIWWPHGGHRIIIGATSSLKSTAALLPLLLNDDGMNAFVIDPADGELFANSAHYRAWLLQGTEGVVVIDPCAVNGETASLNPLDVLHRSNPGMVRDARKLVDAVVMSSGHERDPFWVSRAKDVLLASMLHVCTWRSAYRAGKTGTLMDVQTILAQNFPQDLIEEMAQNDIADGLVQRAAIEISDLKANAPSTWHGVKVQVDASLGFLADPGVRATLAETTFDVTRLRTGRLSLYVTLEKKELHSMSRWLRLIYASVIDRIYNIPATRGLHVVIDEFPALEKFERVPVDLATLKKFGVQFHLVAQDFNQLHELYGHGWQSIVGNCSLRQVMGVNDNFTADYVSHALGQTTRRDGFDIVREHDDSPGIKRWRWVGAPLMSPSELMGMPEYQQIVLHDRGRPFLLPKAPFFANARLAARAYLQAAQYQEARRWRLTHKP